MGERDSLWYEFDRIVNTPPKSEWVDLTIRPESIASGVSPAPPQSTHIYATLATDTSPRLT